ncbi:MAG: OmpA family protein [Bacteroidota bacterium]
MRSKLFLIICCTAASFMCRAQEGMTKADKLFFSYAYADAIEAYRKQLSDGKGMTHAQYLNLADSYFQTKEYKKAADIYMDINTKDTIISVHQFNKMLQALSKTSEKPKIKAFLNTNAHLLSNEVMENSAFNYELLESNYGGLGFQIFNAGCNSPQADFAPSFYKDKLLFSSGRVKKTKKKYGPSGESYLDIYVGRRTNDGKVLNPNPYSRIPESQFHKATPYYASGLNRIFYILSNTEDGDLTYDANGKNALAIGMLYSSGQFRFLLKDLSTSFYYPFFDERTDRLYFAANFSDSFGGTDIYYVDTNNGQIMSEPHNLGPKINSPGNEISPYLLNGSLYFSSDVFYGLGGMDVYKSNLLADNSFSVPVNLGSEINSPADEFGLIIKEEGGNAYSGYFSSNRKGGMGNDDIYGFLVNGELGLKTFLLRGAVTNPGQNTGVDDAWVRILDTNGKLIKELITNGDGEFQLEIPWRDQLVVEAGKERYSIYRASHDKVALGELNGKPMAIQLFALDDLVTQKEEKTVLKLNALPFKKGTSLLSGDAQKELDKVVEAIRKFPKMQLRIESHTDSRGSMYANKRISQQRADAIRQYLLNREVPEVNIVEAVGYGEEKILNRCKDGVYCLDFLHNQNLRTLLVVENYGELE